MSQSAGKQEITIYMRHKKNEQGEKKWNFSAEKNVEKTSCFTVFYTKFFPIVRIKKMEKLKTMASV